MKSDLSAYDFWLNNVAHDSDEYIEQRKLDRSRKISEDCRNNSPWNHDTAGTENRKNIKNCNAQSDQN